MKNGFNINEFILLIALVVSFAFNLMFLFTGSYIQKERDDFARRLGRK